MYSVKNHINNLIMKIHKSFKNFLSPIYEKNLKIDFVSQNIKNINFFQYVQSCKNIQILSYRSYNQFKRMKK